VDAPPRLIEFENLIRLLTFVGAGIAAWAALTQARIARQRHEEQTKADLQRRITESFTKAVEQLGSDKLQVRLGGIYTLERISRESELDYWPVMEVLTGFLRERARWTGKSTEGVEDTEEVRDTQEIKPPTDVAAVLTVIKRRDDSNRKREKAENWRLDFSFTDLRGANLNKAHLEGASFHKAHLEGAFFFEAHLEDAYLSGAHLEGAFLEKAHLDGASLMDAHLDRANLTRAHLDRVDLMDAHLDGANLTRAHLEGAFLLETHLEGANLAEAVGLVQRNLDDTIGDAKTRLPEGLTRPAHWSQG
jgi:uncharacterized protein YjbI with pentapeptide repeats